MYFWECTDYDMICATGLLGGVPAGCAASLGFGCAVAWAAWGAYMWEREGATDGNCCESYE